MQVQNSEIAKIFDHVADLLEIKGDNPFRIRAYRNAARTLTHLPERASDLVRQQKDLSKLPGIGKDLATKISEIVETGNLLLLERLKKRTPPVLRELLQIEGIGPKKVQALNKGLGIKSLFELKHAIENGKILKLKGFGEKTTARILEEIKKLKISPKPSRLKLFEAESYAKDILNYLGRAKGVEHLIVAGSFRRRRETVGDLDILVTAKNSKSIIDYFVDYSEITKVLSHGATRSTVNLRSGLQVDLRAVADESYGAALLYFTGSKSHNIALRSMAVKRGMKINEYGIYKGAKKLASKTEEEIYRTLKLPYIEPELRENRGEIEAAVKGKLPKLIEAKDIQGDLHVHTKASDGSDSIKDLISTAKKMNYSYIAITDHSKSLTVAHGLDKMKLLKQLDEIDRINSDLKDFTIFKSMEVDILVDGSLDLSEDLLKKLDFTVCAIHSHFNLSREKQTSRILRAMENPYFNILAHPTGRLIGEREAYDFDLEKILKVAKDLDRIIEINSQPQRMDLSGQYCKLAKEMGIKMAISTDAHSTSQLNFMKYGVSQARRGWLEKKDVINTKKLSQIKALFRCQALFL